MGLTFDKIFVILVIAMFLVGPDRLPIYAKRLGELTRGARRMANDARDRLRDEMGPEFDEVDWKQLDPRQYDPRRIIRDALVEDEREARREQRQARAVQATSEKGLSDSSMSDARLASAPATQARHYDDEAT